MRFRWRVGGLLALLLFLPAVIALCALALPPQYSRAYPAALVDKAALLEDAASPRIVVIGGSGAAFDLDSSLLETQFPGYRVVNFGLYAGLGTTVMLELAAPDLRAGDIIVFTPEISSQTLSDWFDAETMWQASEENPALLTRLDRSRWKAMLAALPRYAARKLRFALSGSPAEGDPIYSRASFDGHGDILPDLRPANRMPGGWDLNAPVCFDDAQPTEGFLSRVNSFAAVCGERGIHFLFRFCQLNAAAVPPEEMAKAAAFEAQAREALTCEIIGSCARAIMDAGWFFDTNFHLNSAGAVINTLLLAEDLKLALGDPTPVTIARPERPGTVQADVTAGNDADAALFVYEAQGSGVTVVGLTEAGKTRATLTVPTVWQGLPVLAVARGAFSGSTVLKSVTIQANPLTVQDGAFAGCSGLREIRMLQENPSLCVVGHGLLEDVEANVTVPAERFGAYCTNYFWAAHTSRLRPSAQGGGQSFSAPRVRPVSGTGSMTYDGNGGTLRGQEGDQLTRGIAGTHLRENTLQGMVWFHRPGWTLVSWNTAADGSGVTVGLGSRIDPAVGTRLFAQWLRWSPDAAFDWRVEGSVAVVTGYHGPPDTCVIPETYRDCPVRGIAAGAFAGRSLETVVLPPSLRWVEDGAFSECDIAGLILYDSLETVSDACFEDCAVASLRINAAVAPAYSGSYFSTFQDKLDFLRRLSGQRKLVLSSGSSGRYGYDCEVLDAAFLDLTPVNMGVYAYTNALPQLMLIRPMMEAGDILLYAPEFDAIHEQFCVTNRLDPGFWAMMETNYDAALSLDFRDFTGVFDSLGAYLRARMGMPKTGYEVSAANYDDDGAYYSFSTYNLYGDFILPRPNGDTDERLRHNIADYTLASFPDGTVQSLNAALKPFMDRGVRVYFSYTPRNSASLTEASTPEARAALDLYLRETLDVPVITAMEDDLMPGRYFWLIDSHLSTEGAAQRTRQIIIDLNRALSSEQE